MQTAQEPGALDNRMSVNPNDPQFADTKDWKDGSMYNITGKVQQVSPGEFEVVELTGTPAEGEAENADEAAAPAEENDSTQAPPTRPTYGNPAVAGMMQ